MPYYCPSCGEWHVTNERIVAVAPANLARHDYRRDR
jgi:hypothetical protein